MGFMWYGTAGHIFRRVEVHYDAHQTYTRLILGLRQANERRRYFVTTSLIGWAKVLNEIDATTILQQKQATIFFTSPPAIQISDV